MAFKDEYGEGCTDTCLSASEQEFEPSYAGDDLTPNFGEAVERALTSYTGERILDAGCGYATGVPALTGEKNEVLQVDWHRESLEELQENYSELGEAWLTERDIHVYRADIRDLPFKDNTMDVVFIGGVIDSATNDNGRPDYSTTDALRVLDESGDLVIADHGFPQMCATAEQAIQHIFPDQVEGVQSRFTDVTLDDTVLILSG